jgi:hypothetical protein
MIVVTYINTELLQTSFGPFDNDAAAEAWIGKHLESGVSGSFIIDQLSLPSTWIPKLTDTEALNIIQNAMSGKEWDADTFEDIQDALHRSGRTINDV